MWDAEGTCLGLKGGGGLATYCCGRRKRIRHDCITIQLIIPSMTLHNLLPLSTNNNPRPPKTKPPYYLFLEV